MKWWLLVTVHKESYFDGAVEQVSSKVLESRAITNVGAALQGATPVWLLPVPAHVRVMKD